MRFLTREEIHDGQEITPTATATATATATTAATTAATATAGHHPCRTFLWFGAANREHRLFRSATAGPPAAKEVIGSVMIDPTPAIEGVSDDDGEQEVWQRRCNTLSRTWVQVRYHRRRQRFFDLSDKCTKAVTVVLGASLLGQFFKDALPWFAVAITSLGLLALVFGYSDRKQQHKELAEQAAQLVGTIEQVPVGDLTPADTANWNAEYARLCAKAPPPLKTLSLICECEQAAAEGHPAHLQQPGFFRRLVADFIS